MNDNESTDTEATSEFDNVIPEIVIYTYTTFDLRTKSKTGSDTIQDLFVKLVQLSTFQTKVRNEIEESATTSAALCAVAETLSIDGFKELPNVNNALIIRFLESRLALLILHHRFVSNLFIYSVIEDETTIRDYYEGVGEELTSCIMLFYTFAKAIPQLRTLHYAAIKECNMIINYDPEFYPELAILTKLIVEFVREINITNPREEWMLLDIKILGHGQLVDDTDDTVMLSTPPTTPRKGESVVAVTESTNALQLESLPTLDPDRKRAKVEKHTKS
jgi:hypothetical protein